MARSPIKAASENDVTQSAEKSLDFDDDNLRATAEVYKNEGNDEYNKEEFANAIHFYTEGIKVKCKDEEVNAKLHNNRATAHFYLGNYHDSLSDAKTATTLQPKYLKAFYRGASACVKLNQFEEAIAWCDQGLAFLHGSTCIGSEPRNDFTYLDFCKIDNNNKELLEIKNCSVKEQDKCHKNGIEKTKDKSQTNTVKGKVNDPRYRLSDFQKAVEYHNLYLSMAKDLGNKSLEGATYGSLGNHFRSLGDFKKAVEYHSLTLSIAKDLGDKSLEGAAYGSLGNDFRSLGDFKKAVQYHSLLLSIAKDLGDKSLEGAVYDSLGDDFRSLGDFKKAVEYHSLHLSIAEDLGDKSGERVAYGNLGIVYGCLGDFKKALEYHSLALSIAKELGDKSGEGAAYGNLGIVFSCLGDFKKSVEYHSLDLSIAKDLGDKSGEGAAYGNLGNAFDELGDFKKAVEYHSLDLSIAKDLGDKSREGSAYGNLGNDFRSLGDFKKAVEYHSLHLSIAEDLGDKSGKGLAYGNLGSAFRRLGDFKKAVEYHSLALSVAKDLGDKSAEGRAYGNLGNAFYNLGDFNKAVEYHILALSIVKDLGDKSREGNAYGNLGNVFHDLGDFNKAVEYHSLHLSIAKDLGDKSGEGAAYCNLGNDFYIVGSFQKSEEYYQASVNVYNDLRSLLHSEDKWKIGWRNECNAAYTGLWKVLLKQGKIDEALFAAENGRAQALVDLIESQYAPKAGQSDLQDLEETEGDMVSCTTTSTAFLAIDDLENEIHFWVLNKGKPTYHRKKKLDDHFSKKGVTAFQTLIQSAFEKASVGVHVRCENRSLDALREGEGDDEHSQGEHSQREHSKADPFVTLYNYLIAPIADLVQGDEPVIVPDGVLWLAPFAAFVDPDSKYLCESFRIRVIPSLTSLKLIADYPSEYHSRSGALLVGDPCVADITNNKGEKILEQLPFARKEVEMIGQILNVTPLTGRKATKSKVLEELSSVALVHIAAHGCIETGEIALSPNPKRPSQIPAEEDYILTMDDVTSVKLRASLVVLSCCHSGRGEIKAEGVVGIARAFIGAGARSVLVALWAIDDEATLEFMRSFYQHLLVGRSASESLNLAMKCLRESDQYNKVKDWAPFTLIGDDVTLQFDEKK